MLNTKLSEQPMYVVVKTPTPEQQEVLQAFADMLATVSRDGGKKRAAGLKPSWKIDTSHEAALFSHLNKWKHGEKLDDHSWQHPLVHLAWRALAIAWQETESANSAPKECKVLVSSPASVSYPVDGNGSVVDQEVGLNQRVEAASKVFAYSMAKLCFGTRYRKS